VKGKVMRKLVLKMSITLDGFVGGPNGEIDWILRNTKDQAIDWLLDTLGEASLHVMGSRTFKDMAAWWPTSDEPLAKPMNEIPKAVFSRTGNITAASTTQALVDAARRRKSSSVEVSSSSLRTWSDAEIVTGDLTTGITRLKQQPGGYILAHGGASFAQSLVATGLIDEYQLLIHPVAVGRGLPLFSKLEKPLALELIETKRFDGGPTANIYRPVGD
jgi:dihydrofolate reductase